jgi:transcriptional regulator with XRE-family HTH domain
VTTIGQEEGDLAGFGERVRVARERLRMKQEQLAELVATDAGSVSRWERGKGYPQAPQLAKLAAALGESLDYLVLGAPSKAPQPMPQAFLDFLQTRWGRVAQEHALVPTLLSVRLPPGEPTVAFYRALIAALVIALDEE